MKINNTQNRLRVFLSHSSLDKPFVRTLYKKLVSEEFDAWLDEEKLLPGQDWNYEIESAMKASDAIIICLSNNSVSKAGYIQREIKRAIDLAQEQPEGEIFLIPARIENCNIPNQLMHLHSPEVFREAGYQKLIEALKVRANKLNCYVSDNLTETYRDFLETYTSQAFSYLFWDKFDSLSAKSATMFNVGLVGWAGTGKTSLIYTLAETDFNFLQYREMSADYTAVFKEDVRFVEFSFDLHFKENVVERISSETDLIFFTVSASNPFRKNELQLFEQLKKLNIPIVVLLTRMDAVSEEQGRLSLRQIRETISQPPVPVSVVEGINIDSIKKFILKARKFYE